MRFWAILKKHSWSGREVFENDASSRLCQPVTTFRSDNDTFHHFQLKSRLPKRANTHDSNTSSEQLRSDNDVSSGQSRTYEKDIPSPTPTPSEIASTSSRATKLIVQRPCG